MGEKGIGRLAIAAIGPQVLALTRARFPAGVDELVAALIHWGLFALPGIDLGAIRIPIRVFAGGLLPDASDIAEMVREIRANVTELAQTLPPEALHSINADLNRFNVDPQQIAARLPAGPVLTNGGRGTHFLILPAEETLADDIDGRPEDDVAPPLIKALIGFTNTMTPDHRPPSIAARFRDHQPDGIVEERIADSAFFTPEEFQSADHHVSVCLMAMANFAGRLRSMARRGSIILCLGRKPEASRCFVAPSRSILHTYKVKPGQRNSRRRNTPVSWLNSTG